MEELYIDSVAHRYGKRQIINNVYLKCEKGEVVGILGRNGCGKSTLLKIIFGSVKPQYKHLKINGILTETGYKTRQISYLPQENFLPAKLKVETIVRLFINKYRDEVYGIDFISEHLQTPLSRLSGGELRLVECLMILYSDSDYVLLDEPFSQLAPLIADELKKHINKLKSVKGFIVTDHHYRQILSISSRVVLLHNGGNYTINSEEDLKLHGYLPPDK